MPAATHTTELKIVGNVDSTVIASVNQAKKITKDFGQTSKKAFGDTNKSFTGFEKRIRTLKHTMDFKSVLKNFVLPMTGIGLALKGLDTGLGNISGTIKKFTDAAGDASTASKSMRQAIGDISQIKDKDAKLKYHEELSKEFGKKNKIYSAGDYQKYIGAMTRQRFKDESIQALEPIVTNYVAKEYGDKGGGKEMAEVAQLLGQAIISKKPKALAALLGESLSTTEIANLGKMNEQQVLNFIVNKNKNRTAASDLAKTVTGKAMIKRAENQDKREELGKGLKSYTGKLALISAHFEGGWDEAWGELGQALDKMLNEDTMRELEAFAKSLKDVIHSLVDAAKYTKQMFGGLQKFMVHGNKSDTEIEHDEGLQKAYKKAGAITMFGITDPDTEAKRAKVREQYEKEWAKTHDGKAHVPKAIPMVSKAIPMVSKAIPIEPRPFATGGIVTHPTLATIGEAGKEAVIPLESALGKKALADIFGITANGDTSSTQGKETLTTIRDLSGTLDDLQQKSISTLDNTLKNLTTPTTELTKLLNAILIQSQPNAATGTRGMSGISGIGTSGANSGTSAGGSPIPESVQSAMDGINGLPVSIKGYGPAYGEKYKDAMVGTRDNPLRQGDVALSPDLYKRFGFGAKVDIYSRDGKLLKTGLNVADLSMIQPGRPNHMTAELWNDRLADKTDIGRIALSGTKIAKLATGGIIDSPIFSMLGESGREAVIPLESSRGMDALNNLSANNTQTNPTINLGGINITVNGGDSNIAQQIGEHLKTNIHQIINDSWNNHKGRNNA